MDFKLLSFKGGAHPPSGKHFTQNKPVEKGVIPKLVIIPLQQHIGAPCEPLVKPGDTVRMGQKIGESKGFVSAPIHSSVSGKVKSIGSAPHPTIGTAIAITIENDGQDTMDESVLPLDYITMSPDKIIQFISESGIVGMGGAAFPTHVKLSPPADKTINTIILNGAECEPYLTADHRLMVESPQDVVEGLKILMRALGVEEGYIGIENNKPDALKIIRDIISDETIIKVSALKTKYPQGAEKQLINAVTGKVVPSGGLPMDVGVVVNNVSTAAAVSNAFKFGLPLIERIVTVTGGGIKEPKNLLVRIGTPFKEVIEQCGGLIGEPVKVIAGGPMMGLAQYSLDVPVIKGTSGILILTSKEAKTPAVQPCIRCGKCVETCSIHLMPINLSAFSLKGDFDSCENQHALDCIECGSCSFICPAKRPLVQSIRVAKREIIQKRKRNSEK